MRRLTPDFKAANTDVVAVGNGRPEYAKDFVEKTGFEGKVYCDRDQGSYKLAGMKHPATAKARPANHIVVQVDVAAVKTPRAPKSS